MRIKYTRLITILLITINLIIVYYVINYLITDNFKRMYNKISLNFNYNSKDELNSNNINNNNNNNNNNIENDNLLHATTLQTIKLKPKDRIQATNKHIKKLITIIIRDFYHYENDLKNTIDNLIQLIPNIQIIIIYDNEPYPPIDYLYNKTIINNNIKIINLKYNIKYKVRNLLNINIIKTRYVLLIPDSLRLNGRGILQKMLREIDSNTNNNLNNKKLNHKHNNKEINDRNDIISKIIIIPFQSTVKSLYNCYKINVDFTNWTIEYRTINGTDQCDMYLHKHAILMETQLLKDMPDPLTTPFPELFYIQAKLIETKKIVLNTTLQDGKRLFTSYHTKQRRKEIRREQFKRMYKKLEIKKVIRRLYKVSTSSGGVAIKEHQRKNNNHGKTNNNNNNNNNNIQNDINGIESPGSITLVSHNTSLIPLTNEITYYGCEKNTRSCIGKVYNMKPFYVYLGRHTPPCCVEKLKIVFFRIIEEFENVGIRYWLDNLALKSAIDTNTLSIDGYEIDISFNVNDLERSMPLKKSQSRPFTDNNGFYWIKATDGHYFKVQYSKMNQIGVNLLPFELSNDHIKPNNFFGWKAKEFSVDYLHPMSTVLFLGKNIMCPNNVREFLEMKNIK